MWCGAVAGVRCMVGTDAWSGEQKWHCKTGKTVAHGNKKHTEIVKLIE